MADSSKHSEASQHSHNHVDNLHAKILELLHNAGYGSEMVYETDDNLVSQIISAVKAVGYKQVIDLTHDTQVWAGKRLMTGDKWFANFEKEIDGVAFSDAAIVTFFVSAARKASTELTDLRAADPESETTA